MTTPPDDPPLTESGSADDEYARTYVAGYAEGVRSALRDVLAQAARGHTVAELRMLVQSRLAQLSDEVERKRRTLLAVPRESGWSSGVRVPPPRPWPGPAPPPRVSGSTTYLARENRPRIALELVREASGRFDRVILISASPPELPGVPAERCRRFALGSSPADPSIESLAGEIHQILSEAAPSLVYLDAIEHFELRVGPSTTLKFVEWLAAETRSRGGALVASSPPTARGPREESQLEHAFQVVL
ncbi:MAG: hypothetical protein ACREBZ_01025 [Thermoplasmata archaeon]